MKKTAPSPKSAPTTDKDKKEALKAQLLRVKTRVKVGLRVDHGGADC